MATISLTAEQLQGRQLLDEIARAIGEISDLYVDDDGRPHWLLVDSGFFPDPARTSRSTSTPSRRAPATDP